MGALCWEGAVRTWRCPHAARGHQARCPSTWPRRRWATWPATPIELQRILPAAPPRLARGRCRLTPARPHPCPAAQLPAPQLWRAGCIVPLGRGGSAAPTAKGGVGGAIRVHRTSGTRAPGGALPQRCRRGMGGERGVRWRRRRAPYLSGMNLEDEVAPIPGRP